MSAYLHVCKFSMPVLLYEYGIRVRVRYMYDGRGPCTMPKPGGALRIKLTRYLIFYEYHKSSKFN